MSLPARLHVAPDLLRFRRGERLLLVDGLALRPLLVAQGAPETESLLDEIEHGVDTEALASDEAGRSVLGTLLAHGIVRDAARPVPAAPAQRVEIPDPPVAQSLYLLLAQDCNLGCVYCLNGEQTYHRQAAPRMSPEVAFTAVESCFKRLKPGGTVQIIFFGGEPLLNWPLAKQIIDHVEGELVARYPDRKHRFHLTSNLARLPRDLVDRIKRHNIGVLCDVDGPPELHDTTRPFRGGRPSCERISANVRTLVDAGIEVALRATVTARNVERMLDVARYHRELGGSGSAMVAVNAVNSDEDVLDPGLLPDPATYAQGLRDIVEQSGWPLKNLFPFNTYTDRIRPGAHQSIACGAPYGNTPVVDVNGDVYACIYLVGMTAYRIGNVSVDDGAPDRAVLQRMMKTLVVDNIDECVACAYRYVCAGGCPVGHLLVSANPKASETVRAYHREMRCVTTRTVVEAILWDVAERATQARGGEAGDAMLPC